ncbi:MAG TPA: hypothetical protein VHV10_02730 [Ktedonobacteraceae bacterium]|jgi:hypothetical protein|nr:hypothetical protein [Ktedonobacteraceae bacterium]
MSNDMLPGLFDDESGTTQPGQTLFDYEQVPVDRRGFVLQKTAETQWLLKRTTEDIISIGKNLITVKEDIPHGMFRDWIECEFGISYDNAKVFMSIAKNLGDKKGLNPLLGVSVLRELASAPEEVVDQVIVGELPPTKEAIKEAKLEVRLAKIEAARSKAEAQAAQLQLFNSKDAAQKEIDELTKQMIALKQEMETLTTPEVEIVEVEKEVIPQSVTNTIEDLQKQIDKMGVDLETEKQATQAQIKEKETKLKEKMEHVARLAAENDQLSEEVRVSFKERHALIQQERTRQQWREDANGLYTYVTGFMGKVPSPLDRENFENDDRIRAAQCIEVMERAISVLREVVSRSDSHSVIIDTNTIVESGAY